MHNVIFLHNPVKGRLYFCKMHYVNKCTKLFTSFASVYRCIFENNTIRMFKKEFDKTYPFNLKEFENCCRYIIFWCPHLFTTYYIRINSPINVLMFLNSLNVKEQFEIENNLSLMIQVKYNVLLMKRKRKMKK